MGMRGVQNHSLTCTWCQHRLPSANFHSSLEPLKYKDTCVSCDQMPNSIREWAQRHRAAATQRPAQTGISQLLHAAAAAPSRGGPLHHIVSFGCFWLETGTQPASHEDSNEIAPCPWRCSGRLRLRPASLRARAAEGLISEICRVVHDGYRSQRFELEQPDPGRLLTGLQALTLWTRTVLRVPNDTPNNSCLSTVYEISVHGCGCGLWRELATSAVGLRGCASACSAPADPGHRRKKIICFVISVAPCLCKHTHSLSGCDACALPRVPASVRAGKQVC